MLDTRRALLAALVLAAGAGVAGADQGSPAILLEEAFYREVAAHDPQAAAAIYAQVLATPRLPPALAARARLRLGVCARVLGRKQEAARHFETVIQEHPTEADAVRLARRYLGQPVLEDLARFLPPDAMLYAEVVRPSQHVRGLSEILKGTPFENPVDYYRHFLGAAGSGSQESTPREAPGTFHEAAAVLNEGFLRDLERVDGIALGVPGTPRTRDDFLLVILPGGSNILRGLVQMELTRNNIPQVYDVCKLPVFRLPSEERGGEAEDAAQDPDRRVHLALGDALGGEVIVLGRPWLLLREAVERYASRSPSLADDPEFHRAQAARAGSLVFAYLHCDKALEALRAGAAPQEEAAIGGLRQVLGLDRLPPVSFTVATSANSDSLRLALQVRLEGRSFDAWEALGTEPLDDELLRVVPRDSLGFAAWRCDRGPERWEALHRMVEKMLALSPEEKRDEAKPHIDALYDIFAAGEGRAFLEEVKAVVLACGSRLREPWPASFFFAFRFRTPERGGAALEAGMSALLHAVFRNQASRTFFSEKVMDGGRELEIRSLEPVPGVRLGWVRRGDFFIASLSRDLLVEAVRVCDAPELGPAPPLASGTAKALGLRPAALVREAGSGGESATAWNLPAPLRLFLGELEEVHLSTREVGDHLSLELHVPRITPTVRAVLRKLTTIPRER